MNNQQQKVYDKCCVLKTNLSVQNMGHMALTSWKPQWSYLRARVTSCEKWPLVLFWVPNIKGTGYLRRKGEFLTFNILSAEWNLPLVRWFYIISSPLLPLSPAPPLNRPYLSYFKHFSFLPSDFLYSLLLFVSFLFIFLSSSSTP